MANASGLDLDEDLTFLRAFEINLDDLQRLSGFEGHCGT
jgi:hypothetical protein